MTMTTVKLPADPFNLVITGVGGQGNVMASRVLGNILSLKGYTVTIGETFGASQRGGSVMSHLRISADTTWSPQIPKGKAHIVVSLEPSETIRVLSRYGNPQVTVLCNTRPVYSIGVITGTHAYPEEEELQRSIRNLSHAAWFLDATNAAMAMGSAVLTNIIMVGALAATKRLPIDPETFESVITRTMPPEKAAINKAAFARGADMLRAKETG